MSAFSPRGVYAISRLLVGHDLNGELEAVSGPLRPIVDTLSRVEVDESLTDEARRLALAAARVPHWETIQATFPDGAALAEAVANIDPDEPPDEADANDDEADDGWAPIRLGELPPVEPFPLDVLPIAARDLAEAAARSIGCPIDFPVVAILAVASGAIGLSAKLRVKRGYSQSASLYMALVEIPSTGKSPAFDTAMDPLREISESLYDLWKTAKMVWDSKSPDQHRAQKRAVEVRVKKARRVAMKAYRDAKKASKLAKPEDRVDEPTEPTPADWDEEPTEPTPADWEEEPTSEDRGEAGVLGRIITTDPTTEALGPILAVNPRGLIIIPDEMTKWVHSMNQYKGGNGGDRPFYLSTWGGSPVVIDRAKNMQEPIMVPHPFLTVAGGLSPGMLSTLSEKQGREDGFLARLLFAYPDRLDRHYSDEGILDETTAAWKELVLALWERPMRDLDGKPAPHVVTMTAEARSQWVAWCNTHYAEQNADGFPDSLRGAWGKLEAYCARLALILHLMDVASDPTGKVDDLPSMPGWIIRVAARLVAYFKSHARRVYAVMEGKAGEGDENVRSLRKWIIRKELRVFAWREVSRDFDKKRHDALASALSWMVSRNMIRKRDEPNPEGKGGRKRSPTFEVNPELLL